MTKPLKLNDLAAALAEGLSNANMPTVLGDNGLIVSQSYNNIEIVDPAPIARAILTTIKEAGYRVVPVKATVKMLNATEDCGWPDEVWQAMLSAAPQIEGE